MHHSSDGIRRLFWHTPGKLNFSGNISSPRQVQFQLQMTFKINHAGNWKWQKPELSAWKLMVGRQESLLICTWQKKKLSWNKKLKWWFSLNIDVVVQPISRIVGHAHRSSNKERREKRVENNRRRCDAENSNKFHETHLILHNRVCRVLRAKLSSVDTCSISNIERDFFFGEWGKF